MQDELDRVERERKIQVLQSGKLVAPVLVEEKKR